MTRVDFFLNIIQRNLAVLALEQRENLTFVLILRNPNNSPINTRKKWRNEKMVRGENGNV
jgi:hypothetical protein